MGAYHIFVNPEQQEFFDPVIFGDGNKHGVLYHGLHRYALKLLFYSPELLSTPINNELNTWTGSPMYIAIDDDNPTPESKETLNDIVGETGEHNLYWFARRNFRDISSPLLKHLLLVVRNDTFLAEFYNRAETRQDLFAFIVSTYYESRHGGLKLDLESNFGKNWDKRYQRKDSTNNG